MMCTEYPAFMQNIAFVQKEKFQKKYIGAHSILSDYYLHTFGRPTSFTQGRQETNEFHTSEREFTLQIKKKTPDRAINRTFSIPKLTTEGLLKMEAHDKHLWMCTIEENFKIACGNHTSPW